MPHTSLRLSDPAHHEQPCLRRFVCAPTCTFDTEEFSALDAWSRLVGMQQQSFATNGEPHASLRRTCPRRVGHENHQHLLRPRILRAEGQLRFTSLLCGTSAVTTATRWPRVV